MKESQENTLREDKINEWVKADQIRVRDKEITDPVTRVDGVHATMRRATEELELDNYGHDFATVGVMELEMVKGASHLMTSQAP
ncbi:hypothetical protein PIB30_048307 [Stylosanthes scabra]|uniref:Uncharacterized protein n=1 Tax=Stylosanthes scabra TaxID=79078 RepID=A0ABU6WI27_9FABA|nr:hypothetical protein [Stylosanthes scabra]